MANKTIGIDAMAIAVPEGYLELADLAAARGVPPGKFIDGLGVERMTVARGHEDPVALAASAARRVLERGGIDPATIGLCVVGTETAVDHSKPVAAYLHRLLGLPQQCRVFEAKHACFGGTAGLLGALDWIASGAARGKRALIVCTDIARYALASAGEPTQGAGAVALIVSEAPRLLALEHGVTGSYAQDVNDFWRPLYSKEAVVDGHHSVQCYLDALGGAYRAWQDRARQDGVTGALARRCYHVPYGKMAKKAHRHVCAIDGVAEAEIDASYQREVAVSLRLPSQVGNIYTGSLYLALASLLDAEAGALEGERIGLFSYGSGCCAEFFAGRVVRGAGAMAAQLRLAEPLAGRRRYTFAEYEAIRRRDEEVDRQPVAGAAFPGVAFLGVDGERRVYAD
ncbi:MAG TPA: hydroxymethylglutaryl-CoA synthase [Kofleriaceae bacterium]|nr:hydroxymethylglutaryl-CoA synthase [Kofleriaceae bacterium]